jgi:hypothetical protein
MLIKKKLKLIIKLIENLLEHINQKLIADLIPFHIYELIKIYNIKIITLF